jgi:hypothetical protein
MLGPRGWFVAVPLLAAASLTVAIRERRLAWLAPPAMVATAFALLVWIYWAGSVELTFWLNTSANRVVDSVMLATAVALPLIMEHLVRTWSPSLQPPLAAGGTRSRGPLKDGSKKHVRKGGGT